MIGEKRTVYSNTVLIFIYLKWIQINQWMCWSIISSILWAYRARIRRSCHRSQQCSSSSCGRTPVYHSAVWETPVWWDKHQIAHYITLGSITLHVIWISVAWCHFKWGDRFIGMPGTAQKPRGVWICSFHSSHYSELSSIHQPPMIWINKVWSWVVQYTSSQWLTIHPPPSVAMSQ